MNCSEFEKNFLDAKNHKLNVTLQDDWNKHKEECKQCQAYSEKVDYYRKRLQTLGFESVPYPVTKSDVLYRFRKKRSEKKKSYLVQTLSFATGTVVGALLFLTLVSNKLTNLKENSIQQPVPLVQEAPQSKQIKESNVVENKNSIVDTLENQKNIHKLPKSFDKKFQIVSGQ
ncbi:MAG: hypothetical protein N2450_00105 [bacterium]|nr:hypothetical protein [bacterium]